MSQVTAWERNIFLIADKSQCFLKKNKDSTTAIDKLFTALHKAEYLSREKAFSCIL